MQIKTFPCSKKTIKEYSKIPIAFQVREKLDLKLVKNGLGGILLKKVKVIKPYIKDYDKLYSPLTWLKDFNMKKWSLFIAYDNKIPIGGAIIAHKDSKLWHLERRSDLAFLWDLRVHPDYRGQKVGKKLFKKIIAWSKTNKCKQLKIETQNTNVPACKFYAKQGCELGEIHRYKYIQNPNITEDVMLMWYYIIKK